jgi:hypothetical protein
MKFQKPLFVIPEGNRQAEQKPGGGGRPKFHGEAKDFELHKRREEILIDNEYLKEGEAFTGYIYLFDALSPQDAQRYYENKLKSDAGNKTEFFVSSSGAKVVYGSFTSDFLNKISEPHPQNPIQRIEKSLEFTVSRQIEMPHKIEELALNDIEIDAKIAIFDSGIRPHSIYEKLILGQENFINDDANDQLGHSHLF